MVSYMNLVIYGIGGIVVAGMALLVAFQEKLVYVPVLPGLTKSYPITPPRLRPLLRTSKSSESSKPVIYIYIFMSGGDFRGFRFGSESLKSTIEIWIYCVGGFKDEIEFGIGVRIDG
ncbi:hypothetical protein Hanom_Chr09g00849871 [Helianthus anomalus]